MTALIGRLPWPGTLAHLRAAGTCAERRVLALSHASGAVKRRPWRWVVDSALAPPGQVALGRSARVLLPSLASVGIRGDGGSRGPTACGGARPVAGAGGGAAVRHAPPRGPGRRGDPRGVARSRSPRDAERGGPLPQQ